MLGKIKIWHFIILISFLLIGLRINLIVNTIELMLYFFILLFSRFSFAMSQVNLDLLDSFFSAAILIIPVFVYLKRNRIKALSLKLDFTAAVIIILLHFFLFAPLVANFNPDFQKDLGVTKLLPPLSSRKVIHQVQSMKAVNPAAKFIIKKDEVVKKSFDENIVITDSVHRDINKIYFRNDQPDYLSNHFYQTENYYLLGTDELGRDIFSRLVYGARISLFVGLGSVVVSLLLGLSLGFLAGYPGGIIDTIINRVTEMFLVFPVLFLIILILALFGNSLLSVIIVLGFSGWMSLFKIVRGEVISLKNKDYFTAARLIGLSKKDLLLKEVLPVILTPVTVNLVFLYGSVILAEAALSYLGLGTGSIYPSWGAMIEAGQNYLSQAWWMILFPGICLAVTLYAANSIGKKIQLFYKPGLK